MASGVSSTIKIYSCCCFNSPDISSFPANYDPFISSLSRLKTVIAFSIACSAAVRCMVCIIIFRASLLALIWHHQLFPAVIISAWELASCLKAFNKLGFSFFCRKTGYFFKPAYMFFLVFFKFRSLYINHFDLAVKGFFDRLIFFNKAFNILVLLIDDCSFCLIRFSASLSF